MTIPAGCLQGKWLGSAQHSGIMRTDLLKRTSLRWRLRALCLAGPCCLAVAGVSAAVVSGPIEYLQSEYLVDAWQTEQGLPDNFLNDIAQTPDGYIWVSTFNGLARFNGVEFVGFDAANTPELPSSRIVDLDLDRKGRLWIRSEYGHLSQWWNGRFKTFTERDGLPEKGIEVLVEDHSGEIWVNTSWHQTNYYHYVDGAFKAVSSTNTLFDRFGRGSDVEGYGWGIRSNYLFSVRPEKNLQVKMPFRITTGWRLVGARDGGMWVIADHVQKFRDGAWEDWGELPVRTDQFTGYMEDRRGNLWIGTGVGELWQAGTNHVIRRFKLQNSAATELGRNILEDAEGNLWLCTGGNGLIRLKPRGFKTYDSRDGLTSDVVRSVAEDRQGNIWMATVNAVDWFPASNPHLAQRHPAAPGGLAWSVLGDTKGAAWVGFYGSGLCRIQGESVTWFKQAALRHSVDIHVVFEDQAGEIHLGTPRGLYRIDGNSLTLQEGMPDWGRLDIRCMAEGKRGELYLGSNGGGLLRKSTNGWERFTMREGLADDHVWALYADEDKTLWIGSHGRGLSRFKDGRFFNFRHIDLPRVLTCILEDDTGHLWFGSKQGLFRAERGALNDLADGRTSSISITHYDRADGMGSSQCTGDRQPTAWKANDGRLWFATMGGVTVVDPRSLPFNQRPPPVAIEQVLIDDKPTTLPRGGRITVPPGGRRLEFRYAGLSFTSPSKVRFQYRLQGVDDAWIEANDRRAAYYTRVPPGDYRFQVIAANNDNVWNKAGASLAVVVQPYLWQTGWFQVLSGILLVGLGAGLARYFSVIRLRRRLADLERKHALERERVRISRDLHDHLGADLSQLALWSELAARETAQPAVMAERVRSVSSLAREVIQNVEEIVWTVNPRNDSLERFTAYVCEFSERVITGAGLRFRWEAPDEIPAVPLPSDLRHNLFLVTKEALNNVTKYAAATEAQVQLHLVNGSFILTISDNGRGFDVTSMHANNGNGNGLTNMRERMADCGGHLAVVSQPNQGTTIRMTVPLPGGE